MKILTTDVLPDQYRLIEIIDTIMITGAIPLTEKSHDSILSLMRPDKIQDPTINGILEQLLVTGEKMGGNVIYGLRVNSVPFMAEKRQNALYTFYGTVAKCEIKENSELQPS